MRAEAAGSDFLAYRDSQERYADFHALRHTYISRIVQSGDRQKRRAAGPAFDSSINAWQIRSRDAVGPVRGRECPAADQTGLSAIQSAGAGCDWDRRRARFTLPKPLPAPAKTGDFLRLAETENDATDREANASKTPEKEEFAADSRDEKLKCPS